MTPLLLQTAQKLTDTVQFAMDRFATLNTENWMHKINGEWSKKEILGHLVDSAANNHIRFIRAQLAEKTYVSFAYEQEFFVSAQNYQGQPIKELTGLWAAYNMHLGHVIRNVNPTKLHIMCVIGNNEPVRLSYLIKDYLDHLDHHLQQIFG